MRAINAGRDAHVACCCHAAKLAACGSRAAARHCRPAWRAKAAARGASVAAWSSPRERPKAHRTTDGDRPRTPACRSSASPTPRSVTLPARSRKAPWRSPRRCPPPRRARRRVRADDMPRTCPLTSGAALPAAAPPGGAAATSVTRLADHAFGHAASRRRHLPAVRAPLAGAESWHRSGIPARVH